RPRELVRPGHRLVSGWSLAHRAQPVARHAGADRRGIRCGLPDPLHLRLPRTIVEAVIGGKRKAVKTSLGDDYPSEVFTAFCTIEPCPREVRAGVEPAN